MKLILAYFVFISSLYSCVYAGKREVPESKIQSQEVASSVNESVHVSELLDLVKDTEIQTPEIEPKSTIRIWFESMGISVLYKLHAMRAWFARKISGKKSSE